MNREDTETRSLSKAPPLPGPLLHQMEERENARRRNSGIVETVAPQIIHTILLPRGTEFMLHRLTMKRTQDCGIIFLALLLAGSAAGADSKREVPSKIDLPPKIVSFIKGKEAHARELERKLELNMDKDCWTFLRLAGAGDWRAASRTFDRLEKRSGRMSGETEPEIWNAGWQPMSEVKMILDAFCPTSGSPEFATAVGEGIVRSIPRGSIYFGGTDVGRGLPTAFSKAHADADPFFTLTQNQFADGTYLKYLAATYGKKVYVPSEEDSQKCFTEYLTDAQKRLDHDRKFHNEPRQLKPGEDVRIIDNKVQVSGQVAVMAINGLLAKIIFDKNPGKDFYVEESFPLDWMYPHLTPHGLIFRLNRETLPTLSPEVVAKDREFWTKQTGK